MQNEQIQEFISLTFFTGLKNEIKSHTDQKTTADPFVAHLIIINGYQ